MGGKSVRGYEIDSLFPLQSPYPASSHLQSHTVRFFAILMASKFLIMVYFKIAAFAMRGEAQAP